jgi:predicted phosphoribosyltransferase
MIIFDSIKNRFQLRFKNRVFAANILAGALEDSLKKIKYDRNKDRLLILGIPRGGVVVADVVASKLSHNCEFDIAIPRKLTAPGNQEIAIGAIMLDEANAENGAGAGEPVVYLNEDLIRELDIGKQHIEKEKARQIEEIRRRMSLYRPNSKKNYNMQDRIVILVDDGAATGATIIAAARWIKLKKPKKLIIAIPVTTKNTVELLKRESDLVVTGTTPSASTFKSVGQYYQEFKPVDDEQVIKVSTKYENK